MIVGLPMYAMPELASITRDWWRGLQRHFMRAGIGEVPGELAMPADLEAHWLASRLLFTQTCGYPLTHALAGKVQLVATPCYLAPGCEGSTYRSVVVVRDGDAIRDLADLRGKRVAYNSRDSQSGYNTLRHLLSSLANHGSFFAESIETGGHRASLAYVRTGKVDVASIDCVSLALLERVAPAELAGIRKLCLTAAAPSLPYITAGATSAETLQRLRQGLLAAFQDPQLAVTRSDLLLDAVAILPIEAYGPILDMEQDAMRSGYPALD